MKRRIEPVVLTTRWAMAPGSRMPASVAGPSPRTKSVVVRATQPRLSRTMTSTKPDEFDSRRHGFGRHRAEVLTLGAEVEQGRTQHDRPLAVGDHVVDLTAGAGLAVRQTLREPSARHSGRSRSKSVMLWRRQSSSTSARRERDGIRKRRRWNVRRRSPINHHPGRLQPAGTLRHLLSSHRDDSRRPSEKPLHQPVPVRRRDP